MNEEKLKKKVDALRKEIIKKDKRIKRLYEEAGIHKRELGALKQQRDRLNEKSKELHAEVRNQKEERNKLNEKVAASKIEHKTLIRKIKKLNDEIKALKKRRDSLNKKAGGSFEKLEGIYQSLLVELLEQDIPLNKEKLLFDNVFKVYERLDTAKNANLVHAEILEKYKDVTSTRKKVDDLSSKIDDLKGKADGSHMMVIEFSKELTQTRKSADDTHKKLQEKYGLVKPIMEQVTQIRNETLIIQEEMSPYIQELEKIRLKREEQKSKETAKDIKEKLVKSKRVSLDDFRLLLEEGELP